MEIKLFSPDTIITNESCDNEKERAMKLRAFIYRAEEGGYWAKVPAIPGCVSQGETIDEVKSNIRDALEGCLAVREEMALEEAPVVEELEI